MYCSFHPHHIKSTIEFSQLLRLKRICSDVSDYEHGVKILTQSFSSWGYPYKLISEQVNHASHIVRTKSLTRNSNKNTNEETHHLHYTVPSINRYFFLKMRIKTG